MFYIGSILICAGIVAQQIHEKGEVSELSLALCVSITITCLWKILRILIAQLRKKLEESQ